MSHRPRRAFIGLIAAVAAFALLPATALAAGETLSVAPANPQAGGTTNVTATMNFDISEAPKTVVTSLAPGMLGDFSANPGCLLSQQLTASCQIGTATIDDTAGNIPGTLYLVPAQGSDAAGIDLVTALSPTPQYIGITLNSAEPGGVNLTTTFPASAPPALITGFTANFTTLNGQEFTRLPSSCSAATSTFNITYVSGATGSASSSFTPTGCANLLYSPAVSAAVAADSSGHAELTLGITQTAGESASKTISLAFPSGLVPNDGPLIPCLTGTGCTIGTATANSPLVPVPLKGTVTLGGSATSPTFAIVFPAPFSITINGAVNLTTNSVTFSNVPDIPLSALTLDITGPSGGRAFNTNCQPANVTGNFTGQNGATHSTSAPITYTGCQQKPTASGSTGGLANGHPKLRFKVVHGKGAPNIATVAIGLPGGLKFSRSAFASHKTCTTLRNKKKKCTTTTLIKGLGIKGAKAKSVLLKGGRLVITLNKAAGSVTVTVSGPLVTETKGLQTKVKKHKTRKLTFNLRVTDAKKAATAVAVKLAAH